MASGEEQSIPPGFWVLPVVREAAGRRNIGGVLGAVTGRLGWSQYAVADVAGLTQPQVSRYISGRSQPTLQVVARVADGLGMPSQVRRQFGLARVPALGTGRERAGAPLVWLPQVIALAEEVGRSGDASRLGNWRAAAAAAVAEDARARLAGGIFAGGAGTLPGVERNLARTRGVFLAAGKLPARLVAGALSMHTKAVGMALELVAESGARRELIRAGGESAYLAACCDLDLGDPAGALAGLKIAGVAAREAGDDALAAVVLDGHSRLSAFTGDYKEALGLALEGLDRAAESGSEGTAAQLALRAAGACAALGDEEQAGKFWARAENGFARADPDSDRNWVRLRGAPDCLESSRAVVYAATGRAGEAVVMALNLAARLAGARGRSDALALVNAGFSLALAGEFSAAASAGRHGLAAIRESETRGCMPRAQVLASVLLERSQMAAAHRAYIRDLELTRRQLDALRIQPAR